ncbi:hypothetical protein VNO80_11395 [Phaseolus coccineus]|uniref:Uncharacterized protein n=1 Tax=Phaseolus coccineus TaxID=3886 RepID=A0AAN9NF90_PHACN
MCHVGASNATNWSLEKSVSERESEESSQSIQGTREFRHETASGCNPQRHIWICRLPASPIFAVNDASLKRPHTFSLLFIACNSLALSQLLCSAFPPCYCEKTVTQRRF